MTLDIELFGHLAPDAPRRQALALDRPPTAGELAIRLGVDPKSIGLVTINGVLADLDDVVSVAGRVCFFPPLSGG